MRLVDADYKLIWADVGANVSTSDCVVFNKSNLKDAFETGYIGFPDAEPLLSDHIPISYFVIGEDAFPLREWLVKPFSLRHMADQERCFNYILFRELYEF